jgi:hypothetical protein
MRHSKYFMVLLGVLIFSVTFFLRANHLLDAGSKIGNFALATGIFIFAGCFIHGILKELYEVSGFNPNTSSLNGTRLIGQRFVLVWKQQNAESYSYE